IARICQKASDVVNGLERMRAIPIHELEQRSDFAGILRTSTAKRQFLGDGFVSPSVRASVFLWHHGAEAFAAVVPPPEILEGVVFRAKNWHRSGAFLPARTCGAASRQPRSVWRHTRRQRAGPSFDPLAPYIRGAPRNRDAHDLYLRGLYFLNRG